MKTPARPRAGAAGEIKKKTNSDRSFTAPCTLSQTPATAAELAWQRFRLALKRDFEDGTPATRLAREVAYAQFCSAFLSRPFPIPDSIITRLKTRTT